MLKYIHGSSFIITLFWGEMGKLRTRKCHKCKYTLKSKNFVQLKDGKPVCEMYKSGIPDEIFFKGKYCKKFELANKYNIVEMVSNVVKKVKNRKIEDTTPQKHTENKQSKVISINKEIK